MFFAMGEKIAISPKHLGDLFYSFIWSSVVSIFVLIPFFKRSRRGAHGNSTNLRIRRLHIEKKA